MDKLKPKINPVNHWISVLKTPGLPALSYKFAREALTNLKQFQVLEDIDKERKTA